MDKKKLFTIFIGLMVIGLMVTSVLNFGLSTEERFKYKDYVFAQTESGWVTYKNEETILIAYDPRELENMNANVDMNNLFLAGKIYLALDPRDDVNNAIIEFFRAINFNVPVLNACTVDIDACAELPLKSCEDASQNTGVITFREGNETKVEFVNNCLIFEGKGEELVKLVDKFILNFKGIR